MVDDALAPCVREWSLEKGCVAQKGTLIGPMRRFVYVAWADDIVLVAETVGQARKMAQQVADALRSFNLEFGLTLGFWCKRGGRANEGGPYALMETC